MQFLIFFRSYWYVSNIVPEYFVFDYFYSWLVPRAPRLSQAFTGGELLKCKISRKRQVIDKTGSRENPSRWKLWQIFQLLINNTRQRGTESPSVVTPTPHVRMGGCQWTHTEARDAWWRRCSGQGRPWCDTEPLSPTWQKLAGDFVCPSGSHWTCHTGKWAQLRSSQMERQRWGNGMNSVICRPFWTKWETNSVNCFLKYWLHL